MIVVMRWDFIDQTVVQSEADDGSRWQPYFLLSCTSRGVLPLYYVYTWSTHTPQVCVDCVSPATPASSHIPKSCSRWTVSVSFSEPGSFFCFVVRLCGSGKVATCPSLVNSASQTASCPTSSSCPPHLSLITTDSPISHTCVSSSLYSRLQLQVHRCSLTVICVSSQSPVSELNYSALTSFLFLCAAKQDVTWQTPCTLFCSPLKHVKDPTTFHVNQDDQTSHFCPKM